MTKIKNGLILAGGDSTRFWPLGEKNIFSFLGKPLIFYQLEQLSQHCENITIVTSITNAVAINGLVKKSSLKTKCQVINQKDIPGQAGAILSAKNLVKGETLIVNANDIINYSILDGLIKPSPPKDTIILFGKKLSKYFPGGYFKFDNKNKIIEIIEKPVKDKMPSSIYNLVVHYYSNIESLIKAFESIKNVGDNRYELAINQLLGSSINRDYFIYEDYWQSLRYPWHVLAMMRWFLANIKNNQIASSTQISKKALIIGPVMIADNVKIGDFVKIVGPTYIGKNSIVGDYSLIRESQIGENCLIGSFTEAARSYISDKVLLHRNYVGDSVLDEGAMMGAQAATANFRFNGRPISSKISGVKVNTGLVKFGAIVGRQSKIGVNSTLLPGVKIGKKTYIGPGEVVDSDIKDNKFFFKGEKTENNL